MCVLQGVFSVGMRVRFSSMTPREGISSEAILDLNSHTSKSIAGSYVRNF